METDVAVLKDEMIVVNKRLDGIEVKLRTMDIKTKRKFKVVDMRFDRLEKRIDVMDEKFESKIDALDKKLDAKIEALDKKIDSKIECHYLSVGFGSPLKRKPQLLLHILLLTFL